MEGAVAREDARAVSRGTSFDGGAGARIAIVGPAYPLRGGNALFVAHLYDSLRLDHDAYVVSFTRLYPSLLFPGKTQLNISHAPVSLSLALVGSDSFLARSQCARFVCAQPG